MDMFQLTALCLILGCIGVSVLASLAARAVESWRVRLERRWQNENSSRSESTETE